MGRDREPQAQVHARRVVLDRGVDERLQLREGNDLVELPVDLAALHPENGPIQIDVLASGQLAMESRADFEQGSHPSIDPGVPFGGLCYARQDLEESALPRAVRTDDSDGLSACDLERHVTEGPDRGFLGSSLAPPGRAEHGQTGLSCTARQRFAQRRAPHDLPDAILLAEALYANRELAHRLSDHIGEGAFHAPEVHGSACENREGHDGRDHDHPSGRRVGPEQSPPEPLHDAGHGIDPV